MSMFQNANDFISLIIDANSFVWEFNCHLELNSHLYPGDGQSKLSYFYDVVKLIKTHVLTDNKNTIQRRQR